MREWSDMYVHVVHVYVVSEDTINIPLSVLVWYKEGIITIISSTFILFSL